MALLFTQSELGLAARRLEDRTGLHFAPSALARVEAGLRHEMAAAGIERLRDYLALVDRSPQALECLVDELTVGETYFFREPQQFAFIRSTILPEIRERRGAAHAIGVWSAGCASGEEAYSLAILLEQEGCGRAAHILATDVSRAQLARAREASYGAWSLRGDGLTAASAHLRRSGERFVLDEAVRRRVDVRHLNLALDAYPSFASGTWGRDLILCRNVLIYLGKQTVASVAARLYESLAEGGWLVTGPSDPLLAGHAPFAVLVTPAGVFYRRVTRPAGHATTSPHRAPPVPAGVRRWRAASGMAAAPAPAEPLAEARERFGAGDYARVVELTRGAPPDPAAAVLRVRAIANLSGSEEAEREASEALRLHPLSTELHFLWAVVLADLGRLDEACAAVRRVLYLDRSLSAAHFLLGSVLARRGDVAGARRAYRNAHAASATRPPDEEVPLGDGELAGRLAAAAAAQIEVLT